MKKSLFLFVLAICATSNAMPTCNGVEYNPLTHFCGTDSKTYAKCGGNEYNSSTHFCNTKDSKVYEKCNNNIYDPVVSGCCNKNPLYNPEKQFCAADNRVYQKCGGSEYNPSTHFCNTTDNKVYERCSNKTYNPATQFCNSNVYGKCNSSSYDPTKQGCCNSVLYDISRQNCINGKFEDKCIYKCGNNNYDPSTQFCYNNSKAGNKCGNRAEEYDPDIYECRPTSNPNGIYLKKDVDYGGKRYAAVLINGATWMAENLNYKINASSGWDVCYKEEFPYCEKYGRLYDWAAAMGLPFKCNNVYSKDDKDCNIKTYQGICPSGWRIPTSADWDMLYRYVDNVKGGKGKISTNTGTYDSQTAGKYLKAAESNGEDTFGFSARLGGGGFPTNMYFYYAGNSGFWWSASENTSGGGGKHAYNQFMSSSDNSALGGLTHENGLKQNLLSVRCIKD